MKSQDLHEFFGVAAVLDLSRLSARAENLVHRLETDPNPVFYQAVRDRERPRKSVPAVALIAEFMMKDCVEAGEVDDDGVYLMFLLTLFIWIIDEYVDLDLDPNIVTVVELEAYMQRMMDACKGLVREEPDDPIINYLWSLSNALRVYPAYDAFESIYLDAVQRMLHGMVQEYRLRGDPAVNLDNYMEHARASIGSSVGLTAALIVLGDITLETRHRQIRVAYDIVSSILRYSNDMGTYERELIEGNVTSLQLAAKKFGIPADRFHFELAVVLQIVRALMQSEVYDLKDCLGYIRSKGRLFETVLVNAVLGVVKLYERADFHTLGLAAPGA